jgi:hypothetical protein
VLLLLQLCPELLLQVLLGLLLQGALLSQLGYSPGLQGSTSQRFEKDPSCMMCSQFKPRIWMRIRIQIFYIIPNSQSELGPKSNFSQNVRKLSTSYHLESTQALQSLPRRNIGNYLKITGIWQTRFKWDPDLKFSSFFS